MTFRSARAAAAIAAILVGLAGWAASSGPAQGDLFANADSGQLCGPMALYKDGAVTLPIELQSGSITVTKAQLPHLKNVSVSRVSVGRLRSIALLASSQSTSMPTWSNYHEQGVFSSSQPGQAVAAIHVVDQTKDAAVGPFEISYEKDGHSFIATGKLTYVVKVKGCATS